MQEVKRKKGLPAREQPKQRGKLGFLRELELKRVAKTRSQKVTRMYLHHYIEPWQIAIPYEIHSIPEGT